jgi:hypothetical protein
MPAHSSDSFFLRPHATVVLVNSHDKSSAYQLHCGLFRLVCTYGMVVSDSTFQRIWRLL